MDKHHIIEICMNSTEKNPFAIFEKLVSAPACRLHGPEHHVIVGAALLTAYKNAGGRLVLEKALQDLADRASCVPGGACAYCGAGVSTGMYVSIVTGASPLSGEIWGLPNLMTSQALHAIGKIGGPRCCKRDSYIAIGEAITFTEQRLGIKMESSPIVCSRSAQNQTCIGKRCPFHRNTAVFKGGSI